jgi:hypothetical protein
LYVSGREFSAVIDKRCDCPKAVYELEDYSSRPVNYVRTDRKDIIGVLLHAILQQALGVSPSKYWGSLFLMLIDTTVNADGSIKTKVTVDYKNPYQGSDCNLERGGLCLNAPLRNWVRLYVPAGSKLIESKGTQSPKDGKVEAMKTSESLGKTVFEGFLIVNPLGAAKLEVTYTSPVKSTDGKYRVLIQKQPGTDKQEWLLKLNGKDRKKFELISDTELTY